MLYKTKVPLASSGVEIRAVGYNGFPAVLIQNRCGEAHTGKHRRQEVGTGGKCGHNGLAKRRAR